MRKQFARGIGSGPFGGTIIRNLFFENQQQIYVQIVIFFTIDLSMLPVVNSVQ